MLHGARTECAAFAATDPLITIGVASPPKDLDPFGIYRHLSPLSGMFWR